MVEFPKIETLYVRDEKTHKVIPGQIRCPEFKLVGDWFLTEKVDGTNVRIGYKDGQVELGGKTDSAQMPVKLMAYLHKTFTPEKLEEFFPEAGRNPDPGFEEVVLFGEGYGAGIGKGGIYRPDMAFRLFDVKVGDWWLEPDDITNVANKLGVKTVPFLGFVSRPFPTSIEGMKNIPGVGESIVAREDGGHPGVSMEGIVARTVPMLFTRRGNRLIWKLKFRDF